MISFLICGAQKSGTSALHEYLIDHPELSLSKTKELHIFDNENRDWTEVGIKKIDKEIEKYFNKRSIYKKRGEATPSSMWWKPAMKRIWEYNPNMRLIAILRNPITRAYANWKMEVLKGRETDKFPLSLEEERRRCNYELPYQHRIYSYISRGMYTEQIQRIWKYFPRESLILIKQEELRKRPNMTLEKVYKHIGVAQTEFKGSKVVKSWGSFEKTEAIAEALLDSQDTKREEITVALKNIYKNEIRALEEITGWDCSDWMK